ncbi:DUF4167 domain-containing protein [Croceibacterium sp. TMG7-5b_MA50]|uniref:DUF4167 domain-containing protein n=1 Tax=Croceibacterium sp. TMG7-5b_MA50 TaxID=3121290 RepID=UPI003221D364
MNTNRNNNRRRGRNNNRGPNGGNGGGNRIDSRARGNAPQLLEKYRKLAHDASLNDDRVQTEYYLQFADHYFRVLADSRQQKDEVRGRQQSDRGQSFDEYEEEEDEFDAAPRYQTRGRDQNRDQPRDNGQDRSRREAEPAEVEAPAATIMEQRGVEGDEIDVAADENPFTRDAGRRGRRSRTAEAGEAPAAEGRGRGRGRPPRAAAQPAEPEAETGLNAMILPPSIPRTDADADGAEGEVDPAPAPRARKAPARPRRRAAATEGNGGEDGTGEPLEAVG